MIIIDLIYNLSVLVALSVLSGFIDLRFNRTKLKGKILQGSLFGITAIIGMLYPFHLTEGIIFDGRSIVISLCTLFFGPVSGAIASVVGIVFRIYLGGGGALTGSFVILFSFLIGLFFYQKKIKDSEKILTNLQLYIFGLTVNVVMLLLFLFLPFEEKIEMYKIILPTILGVYPFATMLIGKILLDQEEKQNYITKITASEERWQFALEGAGDGVWDWDAKTNTVFFSHQWKAMLGYSENDISNTFQSWEKLLHPDDKKDVFEKLDNHFKGNTPLYQSEQRLKCKNGSYKWILDRGKVIKWDEEGKPLRIIGTHTDISESKLAEKALKDSEEKYRTILKTAIDGFWLVDINGKLVEVNDTYCRMSGYTMQEILFKNVSDLDCNETNLDVVEHNKRIKDKGEDRFETKHRRKDGSIFDVEVNVQYKDTAGGRWIAFLKDITEKKAAEKSLTESQERFKLAFETSPDAVNINRLNDGMYLEINDGFTRITGFEREDVIGKTSLEINIWDNPEDRLKLVSGIQQFGHVNNLEAKFRLKNGDVIYGLMSASIITLKNEPHILTITRDITDRKYAEEKIRENEEIFRELMKHSPVYIFFKDENIRSIRLSSNYEQMLNMPMNEILGKNMFEIFPTELAKNIVEADRQILNNGELIKVDEELNGRYYTTIKFPIKIEGKPRYLAGFTIDITERKKTEEILKANEEKMRTIVEGTPHLFFYTQNSEAELTYISPTVQKISGYSVEAWMNTKDWFTTNSKFNTVARKKTAEHLQGKLSTEPITIEIAHADGHIVTLEVFETPIFKDGKVVGLQGVAHDISDRKKAEEEIRKLYRGIEQSPASIIITDINGKIEYVNKKFCEVTGFEEDEIIGKDQSVFTTGEKSEEEDAEMWKTILSGNDWQGEFHNRKKNGELFWESASISPIQNENGEITHFIEIKEDISEKKKMINEIIEAKNKAEEMNKLKSNFLANMSHELRTPLVGILGFADFLRNEAESNEIKTAAETIFNSGARLSETLNLILDISKFESENKDVNYQQIDLIKIANEIFDLFKETARKKNLELKLLFNCDPIILNFDERAFRSIINNLVNNAIKFTSSGGVTVSFNLDNDFVEIKVTDTGIGIAEKDQQIIFEEFRQASEGYSRNFEGSGLGLHITKKLVEKFSGNISIESQLGKGSSFIVKLPNNMSVVKEEIENPKIENEISKIIKEKKVKPLALLVDDDPNVFKIMSKYANDYLELETAINALHAIDMVKKKKYSIIFMDINLKSGMDGKQATKIIRRIKGYETIPIIATTAFAMIDDKEEFLSAGCSHYLSKPFFKRDFIELIDEVLKSV